VCAICEDARGGVRGNGVGYQVYRVGFRKTVVIEHVWGWVDGGESDLTEMGGSS